MDLANLDKMKVVDLRNELQTRGLDTKGVKAVLIERLRAYLERGSGGAPPSPATPGRRSRRTRSMTKSPSPSPIKKAPEPALETLEEESNPSNAFDENEENEEKISTPEKFDEKPSHETHLKEKAEIKHASNEENYESAKEAHEEDDPDMNTNGDEASAATSIHADAPKSVLESSDTSVMLEKDDQENEKSIKDETKNHDDAKSEVNDDECQDDSNKKSQVGRERSRSRSHSADRRERRNRSHSVSRSRSRSPHHKSKSHSRSRTRSRSPKRRSGGGSLGSPSKEAEDTGTPEDEPTIEENQFGLSWFDSDLHLRIDPVTFTSAKPMSHDIYALVWSGARTNYGVREGKVCFEVRLSEETNLNRENPFRDEPFTKGFRVGFSMPSSSLLLGESENSYAYCESGRKATNAEFSDFAKPYQLDDVIGCYLDLESTPCTIKYTLNGENLGVAFEFDKGILGDNQGLFPHILTKGYEYEINLADNDNLLVNVERKIRKRRKVKEMVEKKEDDKKANEVENSVDGKEEKPEADGKEEQSHENCEKKEQKDEQEEEMKFEINNESEKQTEELETSDEKPKQTQASVEDNTPGQEEINTDEELKSSKDSVATEVGENEQKEKENEEKSSAKEKDDCGPSPSKRQKIETTEEDEYEEVHPVPRDHMSLLEEFELIALIPEEKYIPGPQRPESRKECEVILMVGLPGAGKTTWVLNHIKENTDKRYHIIGADALIAKMTIDGLSRKSVHKGRFDRIYELCFNVLTSLEDIAVKRRRNFILDQANAYASVQRRKMKGFADFKRIAVVCIPNEEELKRRLADKKEKGHAYTLKDSKLNTLQAAFTLPSLEFGWFDDIIFTDLGMDEAKEEIKKYNEKGKKALDDNHSNREKRQRRDSYRNDNRRRQDDRRRYDNRNDNRWNDRRAGGGGGYYHGGGDGGGNRWSSGGGYRNNSGGYRDDRGYGGGGGGRAYDNRQNRFSSGPQNWVQNNRNRFEDRSNRYSSGGGGSGRYDTYGGGSRDYRSGGGENRDRRDRNRGGNGGGGSSSRHDGHRSGGGSNQRDFRHGHRDTREDSRGGSSATSATETPSKYKSTPVTGGNNGGYDKYNKNQPQANNWAQYPQHQHPVGPVAQQQQQYWGYDMQGYGNQQQWQSMDPQQQQQWMSYWQQQGGAQHAAAGGGTPDVNQYWSQYSYNTSADTTKK